GLYDRDYTRADSGSQFHHAPQMRMTFPKITPVVKWLLIINIGVFLVSIIIKPLGIFIYDSFQLDPVWPRALQLWRLISYQFLHSQTLVWHIFMNMIGLFFLGPTLERHWGSKRFLPFYLGCGVAGGLFYLLLIGINFLERPLPMVGASGAILGMLAACAILFPHFVVVILLFPVPIRLAAVGLTAVYLVAVLTGGSNAGGDAAHLAGMAAGAAYVFSQSWRDRLRSKIRAGHLEKQMSAHRDLRTELDLILQKVHDSGIQSLTSKEKRILKEATKAEQMRDRF
ncbi:MAG: rhomboid family intramembrane serine protease, partial [Planctomycetota bacterium]